jgi:NTP pyrophosphatase (non-canonical NTP hydrolase)
MTIKQYADSASFTSEYPGRYETPGLMYATLGLAGEAGELANQAKKVLRDDGQKLSGERRSKMIDELGDVLWYCAAVADELGVSLSYVAGVNLMKLANRQKAGTIKGDARPEGQ